MPNNEIYRIADEISMGCGRGCENSYDEIVSALSEMRTIALREAAEVIKHGFGYNLRREDGVAAILGRIDK